MKENNRKKTDFINIEGQEVRLILRKKTSSSRQISFSISADSSLTVSLPRFVRKKDIPSLIQEKSKWILTQLEKIQNHPKNLQNFLKQNKILYHNKLTPLQIEIDEKRKYPLFQKKDGFFLLKTPAHFNYFSELKEAVIKGLKKIAKEELLAHLNYWSLKSNIKFNRFALKDTKSRWGSCSSKNNINLSWRLVLCSPLFASYVALHEICHIKEPNHSASFWNLVESYLPDAKNISRQFKNDAWLLHTL